MSHPRAPLRVGLTGGIASGKSTVAELFAGLGVPVIDTDVLAREVIEPGQPALAEVVATFGPAVLGPDGRLDRRRLRERVFRDDAARHRLEAILHPAIRRAVEERSAQVGGVYQIHVIPLLAEKRLEATVDRVLVVDCPRELQIERVMARDITDRAGAERILDAQASRPERLAIADAVIENTGAPASLAPVVERLHGTYVQLATRAGA